MATWAEFEAEAPELAAFALGRLDAHRHKTMATLRSDGSPRISGTELSIKDGEIWLGGMPRARRLQDLRRDPRIAVHSASEDPADDGVWTGDAKLSGIAVEVTAADELARFGGSQDQKSPPGSFELFRIDLTEVSTVRLGEPADHLDIDLWKAGEGVRRFSR